MFRPSRKISTVRGLFKKKERKKKKKTYNNSSSNRADKHLASIQRVCERETKDCVPNRSQNHDRIKALDAVEQQSSHWCGFVKRITLCHIYFLELESFIFWCPFRDLRCLYHCFPLSIFVFTLYSHRTEVKGEEFVRERKWEGGER